MSKKALSFVIYRIGHPVYVDRLDGEGATRISGRWNKKGQKVVYTAQTSSLAILELLGHISDFKEKYWYLYDGRLKQGTVKTAQSSL